MTILYQFFLLVFAIYIYLREEKECTTPVKIAHNIMHFQIHMQELHDMFYDMALLVEEQVRPIIIMLIVNSSYLR